MASTTSRIHTDHDGFFKLPSLAQDQTLPSKPDYNTHFTAPTYDTDTKDKTHDSSDIWSINYAQKDASPGCKTWRHFATGVKNSHEPTLLSETAVPGLEALVGSQTDGLNLKNTETPTVAANQLLLSLLELALGRESVFFKRRASVVELEPTFRAMRILGYSEHILKTVYMTCSLSGQSIDRLKGFVDNAYHAMLSKSHIAVASTIDQVIHALYRHVTGRLQTQSILQLQATVADIMAIAQPCCQLLELITPDMTDVAIISSVFQFASSTDDNDHFRNIFAREALQQVAAPWLIFVSEWLGTASESSVPLSKTRLNVSKGFVSVALESYVDDFGRDLEIIDFRLQEDKIPSFLSGRLAKSIFDTGCGLRFIRSFHPDHPLSHQKTIESNHPPELRFLYTWEEVIELEDQVLKYRDGLWSSVRESKPHQPEVSLDNISSKDSFQFAFFGKDQRAMEESMAASMRHLGAHDQPEGQASTVDEAVRKQFDGQLLRKDMYLSPHWSLIPTLALSGIASVQAQIIGRESLRLLFEEHDLQHHFGLQKQFQLFGNGLFCNRLTQALFDPNFDSAERSSGVAVSSGTLGLRLGGRATWPPASSELRLALMGILVESYSHHVHSGRVVDSALPGDLSFAVRDLSAEEIDKCMDPDSIQALDFLRLSYQTPPALASIITPMALIHYDRIFRLLLRVMRMLHVADQIYHDLTMRPRSNTSNNTETRFVREAKHFVSNFAAYTFDTAITVPWQKFSRIQQEVHEQLQTPLHSEGCLKHALNPEYLRQCHDQTLHDIAGNIFIRKKQRPVLALVEEIFSFILQFAKASRLIRNGELLHDGGGYDFEQLYHQFKQHLQIFITVCRKLSEKTVAETAADSALPDDSVGGGHDSLIDQLLSRLDLESFYVK